MTPDGKSIQRVIQNFLDLSGGGISKSTFWKGDDEMGKFNYTKRATEKLLKEKGKCGLIRVVKEEKKKRPKRKKRKPNFGIIMVKDKNSIKD